MSTGDCLKRLDYPSNDKENILYYPLIIIRCFLKELAGDRRIFCARKYGKEEVEFEVSEGDTSDYWMDTAANAIKPLYQLLALAKMRPDCIWDGD